MDLILAASAISVVAAGGAFAMIFADLAHLATMCGAVFVVLVILAILYVLGGSCMLVVHRRRGGPGDNLSDSLTSPLNVPVAGSGKGKGAMASKSRGVGASFCPDSCRTRRAVCTSLCGFFALLLLVFALVLHLSVIGSKRYAGSRTLHGIDGEIKVTVAAPSGVLHVHATTHSDAHFAQGLLTAEMRLWQMEFQRRVGQGTLSELVGKPGLGHDKMSRTLGLYASAELAYQTLDDYSKQSLDSYAAGVNAYLNGNATLPLEMQLLGVDPGNIAPWRPADSLVWGKLMSLELSGNLKNEMLRYRFMGGAGMPFERVEEVIAPFDTNRFPTVLTEEDLQTTDLRHHLGQVDAAAARPSKEALDFYASYRGNISAEGPSGGRQTVSPNQDDLVEPLSKSGRARTLLPVHLLRGRSGDGTDEDEQLGNSHAASNNWVVHGNRTTSGKPLLANDPHLMLTAPSIWIATHLNVAAATDSLEQDMDVWGASFAGVPGIVIGRNKHIAWGVTNTGVDIQDLFVMEERDAGKQYIWKGDWTDYDTRTETIHVKGEPDPVELVVRSGKAGVIITDDEDVAETLGMSRKLFHKNSRALALRWASIDPDIPDGSGAAFMHINRAQNFDEFRDALRPYVAPAQNFIFADTHGNIGYQMPGFIPRRAAGHTGKYPIAGDGRFDWVTKTATARTPASIPFDYMPRAFNPPRGFIASANNKVTPPGGIFPKKGYVLSHDWDGSNMGYRSRRITNMIEELSALGDEKGTQKLNISGMRKIQLDYTSGLWIDFHPYLAKMVNASREMQGSHEEQLKLSPAALSWANALSSPKTFSGEMLVGDVKPTIFVRWIFGVLELVSKAGASAPSTIDAKFLPRHAFNIVWVLNAFEKGDQACGGDGSAAACLAFAADKLEEAVAPYGDINGGHYTGVDREDHMCLGGHGGVASHGHACAVPRWGVDVHKAVFEHQILHTTPLGCAGDRAVEHGGDDSTVNVGHVGSAPFYAQTAGPSYRHLVDLEDPNEGSLFLSPLGQSGDIFDARYDNLLKDWGEGNYLKMGPNPGADDDTRSYVPA